MLGHFLRFALVGTLGFLVDAGVLMSCIALLDANPYAARAVSFLIAATFTWWLNRSWTFRGLDHRPPGKEWFLFLIANAGGSLINLGVYSMLIATTASSPVIGVACGSLAGLFWNFLASRNVVFRARRMCDGQTARQLR
jgi:putative flippase GtrA